MGSTPIGGEPVTLELTVLGDAARGSITTGERKLKVIRSGGTVYAKGSPESFADLLHVTAEKAESVGPDQWLALPVKDTKEPLVALMDRQRFLLAKSPTIGEPAMVDGQPAVTLTPGGIPGVSLVVASKGKPLILRVLIGTDDASAAARVLPWTATFTQKAPDKATIVRL